MIMTINMAMSAMAGSDHVFFTEKFDRVALLYHMYALIFYALYLLYLCTIGHIVTHTKYRLFEG